MNLHYEKGFTIKDLLVKNRSKFEELLQFEATNVRDKIEEIKKIGSINLLDNAYKLVLFIVEEKEHELITFAKQEGVAWAKYQLTLAFKLEWVQAIRRTLWDFLYNYDVLQESDPDRIYFYTMEKRINELFDQFLSHFFISYSRFKDELLTKQRELVNNLSVPIIPINQEVCILPLIGMIDQQRLETIQDKVLLEIETNQIQTLIIDLSGVAQIEEELTIDLSKIIDGNLMMGCKTILTGLRSEMVKSLINSNMNLRDKTEFKGTLQSALDDIVSLKKSS
ncbi:STAS domain-containing protein [Bacillus sp. JCM 19034]|uniref:STAS domain-containing protein n=1 Tax=Bacillus sp. JCM 19034 TaxID=1481928 RepID=UPI0007838C50|nr:STAS domain-containing protein [Bacillus sp. JCM 19034]